MSTQSLTGWQPRGAIKVWVLGVSPNPAERRNAAVIRESCGTRKGYMRHLYLKESACDPCSDANAARTRDQRTNRADR